MKKKRFISISLIALFILGAIVLAINNASGPSAPVRLEELLSLSADRLKEIDVARMNLLCAQGLNGSGNIKIQEALQTLDQWAELVKRNETKYAPGFFRNRAKYDNSYAKFQAVNLGLTLKNDLNCGYNMDLVDSGVMADINSTRFFKNSQDIFLHGFTGKRTGSCSSLPVLMVAVGRRCGYPLYLVTCKGHLFCRWDDGKERFNIETACPGVDMKSDDYYTQWPHPASVAEIQSEKYLKNLTQAEELGLFCDLRGACLQANGRYAEAIEAYEAALKAFPDSKYIRRSIIECEQNLTRQSKESI